MHASHTFCENVKAMKLRTGEVVKRDESERLPIREGSLSVESCSKLLTDGTGDVPNVMHWLLCTTHATHYSLCVCESDAEDY